MHLRIRTCNGATDFPAISDFLYSIYQPDNQDRNWLQPMWEYAYTHPCFDEEFVSRIGIWETNGKIMAVALYELGLGEVFFQLHSACLHLKPEMLSYAEQHLGGTSKEGKRYLNAYVNDGDVAFEHVLRSVGYEKKPESHRPLSQFVIPDPFPPILISDGFRLEEPRR